MNGAGFILAINLVVAGLLAASFMAIAAWDRTDRAARWFAFAYVLGMANVAMEAAIAVLGAGLPAVVLSFALLLAAMVFFNAGLAGKYAVPAPWRLQALVFAASIVVCATIQDLPRGSAGRMLAYQAPYFLMQAIGCWIVISAPNRRRIDSLLALLLAASALQFLSKPALMQAFGGTGATAQDYLATRYALMSQTMGTVFALALAVLVLIILVRDILAEATSRSETDPLSRLNNRAGFERHAALALQDARARCRPLSLVIADLDGFKAVNDSLGHAGGDRVIAAFAGLLGGAEGRRVAGRMGGEEFAVLLPETNLAAARLFAEGVRSAFAGLAIDGLPAGRRFTASFGVAELQPSEDMSRLMRRADGALYDAKHAGRDCVRVAPASAGKPLPGRLAS